MAKGQWMIFCRVCGAYALGPPHGTTCLDCLEEGYKWCSKCDTVQTSDEFHRRPDSGGLMSSCKECYGTKRNKDQRRRSVEDSAYREERNAQSARSKSRSYATPEGRARAVKYSHDYRMKLRGTYTVDEWFSCLEAFNYACAYCGTEHNITTDHIVAVSKGGWNYAFNLAPACNSCNSSKGASDVVEWYSKQPFYDETRLRNIHKRYRALQQQLLAKKGVINNDGAK